MAMRLISATGRRSLRWLCSPGLCACATMATERSVETRPPGWRIVERRARLALPPADPAWVAATTGQALAGEVATGAGLAGG